MASVEPPDPAKELNRKLNANARRATYVAKRIKEMGKDAWLEQRREARKKEYAAESAAVKAEEPWAVAKRDSDNAHRRFLYRNKEVVETLCRQRAALSPMDSVAHEAQIALGTSGLFRTSGLVMPSELALLREMSQPGNTVYEPIFNAVTYNKKTRAFVTNSGDKHRWMGFVPFDQGDPARRIANPLVRVLMGPDGKHFPVKGYFLWSKAGCKEQPAHSDYTRYPGAWDVNYPVSVIVAPFAGTSFVYWENSILYPGLDNMSSRPDVKKKTLVLEAGDVLVWHGALVHAGAAYKERDNFRFFFYAPARLEKGLVKDAVNPVLV
eukprot:jgi/Mesvir1/1427/Mv14423-RA.1